MTIRSCSWSTSCSTQTKGPVPEIDYAIPFGEAVIRRPGDDVTVVATGAMVREALKAADDLSRRENVELEVIDPRTIVPLDLGNHRFLSQKNTHGGGLERGSPPRLFCRLLGQRDRRSGIRLAGRSRSSRWECNIRPFRSLRPWRKS